MSDFPIRKRKNRRSTSWQLDCGEINGKRVQLSFKTKGEAEDERVKRRATLRQGGHAAFSLSEAERVRYAEIRDDLAAHGATIEEAAAFWKKHAKPAKQPVKLDVLIELCIAAKKEEGKSDRYLTQFKSSTTKFARAGHGQRLCNEITKDDVLKWLRDNQWAEKTWNNYRTDLRTLFQWGIEEKYMTLNPCDDVLIKETDDAEVAIFKVEQISRMLHRAAWPKPGAPRRDAGGVWVKADLELLDFRDCLRVAVLGFFCGLRPEKELGKMQGDAVGEEVVRVRGKTAKSRSSRGIPLSENAKEWLKLCPPVEGGKIIPKNFAKKWKALRQSVGLFDGWPHDVMRHSFATYWLEEHGDEKRLQLLMDHESADMIYKHYKGHCTPAEAKAFWALRPSSELLAARAAGFLK